LVSLTLCGSVIGKLVCQFVTF